MTPNLPALHARFLADALPRTRRDDRLLGVAVAGSLAGGTPDEHSDVDLVVVVADAAFDEVLAQRRDLVREWSGDAVVAAFTGEHVGEPRLIISLVGPPLLHVDLKFVTLGGFAERHDEPHVLWERVTTLSEALAATPAVPKSLDVQWIEDRFWVWVHYGATKVARGELHETLGFLGFLRETVLGPLAAVRNDREPCGLRRLEQVAPAEAAELSATVARYDAADAGRALLACVDLYRRWTAGLPGIERDRVAEELAVHYLQQAVAS
ncbi:nucleotidyltransferase domain-containing protein [Pimelobacter simplex]|uniref:Nucleotidyltransferase domain-containing protein n=1 Tax=Nocardioides simplex TaxID=2045 RepID=A0A7J5E330_NOCSI|nr:nucleotidyltransferase domain-containing protein [Pimelobacter simplex]KAB2812662.1 nucleotidyltransferase domain-containing protein [Pimelobacter simplex]